MSQHEAIEWRTKKNRMLLEAIVILIISTSGVVLGSIGILLNTVEAPTTSIFIVDGFAIFSGIVGGVLLSRLFARTAKGYNRTFWKWVGEEYNDPPLNEWAESLEERNAFPVDGEYK